MKKPYLPTDPHATHVAGERIRALPVLLSDAQAEHELRNGAIKPDNPPVAPAAKPAKAKG